MVSASMGSKMISSGFRSKEMDEETIMTEPHDPEMKLTPYTMEEIYAMVEEGERDFEAGRGLYNRKSYQLLQNRTGQIGETMIISWSQKAR